MKEDDYLDEEWMTITEYPNYSVSDQGRVRNDRNGHVLKSQDNGRGYEIVRLASHNTKVHQLVGQEFLGDKPAGLEHNHEDGDKTYNVPDNLAYVTRQENIQHMYDSGLRLTKRVRIVETGEEFPNLERCAEAIGGFASTIGHVLNGKVKHHRGYSFEVIE